MRDFKSRVICDMILTYTHGCVAYYPQPEKKIEMNLCQYDNHAPGRLTCFYKSLTIFSLKKKKTHSL